MAKGINFLLLFSLLFSPFSVFATTNIRQEINITTAPLVSASGNWATSSARILLDTRKYSSPTYYFEVVASTTAATNGTIYLKNATSSATVTSVTINGTSNTLYRSSSFTAPASSTASYVVVNGNEAVGKGVQSSRIVILQNPETLSYTQTQIEIGSTVLATSSTITTPLDHTKYWLYTQANWNGTSSDAYAEVVFKLTKPAASSTTYTAAGTYTYVSNGGTTVVEAWGAGGGGGLQQNNGGGGGGGGAYARSTTTETKGTQRTIVVGSGGTIDTTGEGGDTTYGTTIVVADGGNNTNNASGATGGEVSASTGQVLSAGGNGGAGNTTDDNGGGGGGSGGPDGAGKNGNDGATPTAGEGGPGGDGNNSLGGAGGSGGNGGAGGVGTANAKGGGGGGGGDNEFAGGNGGAPGGGGGGGEAAANQVGAAGQMKITEYPGTFSAALEEDDGSFGNWTFKRQITAATTSDDVSRARSRYFTPITGRHYRIVASTTPGSTYDIYNAKIIVNQGYTDAGYLLSEAKYSTKSLATTSSQQDLFFKEDGTKMFVNYITPNRVLQYSLSTAWDVSTATYDEKSFHFASQSSGFANGVFFSPTGKDMYLASLADNTIYQYSLGTAWDVSTASYASKSFVASGQDTAIEAVNFSSDGLRMFITGDTNNSIFQYTLTTAWDVSTASYASKSLSMASAGVADPRGTRFREDGTGVFVVDRIDQLMYEFSFENYWDLANARNTGRTFNLASQETNPHALYIRPYGTGFYIGGFNLQDIFQYDIGNATDPVFPTTKLEPQYLLANHKLGAGTGLQTFLTDWDSTEWNTTNAYYHEVSTAKNSSSVIELDTAAGVQIVESVITSPNYFAISASMCMPDDGNLDVKATTNNEDIYSSRILVEVGGTAADCAVAAPATRALDDGIIWFF